MSDALEMAKQFLEKRNQPVVRTDVQPINSFRALFAVKELTVQEKKDLAALLQPSPHFDRDLEELTKITAELKSIQKQAVVLIGERIAKAREILKSYGDQKTFTAWIDSTFQSRKTAYNALAFYDLYYSLSNDWLRDQLKRMPMKASYILASRQAPQKLKEALIQKYEGEKQAEIIDKIQVELPLSSEDRRRKVDSAKKILTEIAQKITTLEDHPLEPDDRILLEECIDRLSSLHPSKGYATSLM
jgi:hypothetical protein